MCVGYLRLVDGCGMQFNAEQVYAFSAAIRSSLIGGGQAWDIIDGLRAVFFSEGNSEQLLLSHDFLILDVRSNPEAFFRSIATIMCGSVTNWNPTATDATSHAGETVGILAFTWTHNGIQYQFRQRGHRDANAPAGRVWYFNKNTDSAEDPGYASDGTVREGDGFRSMLPALNALHDRLRLLQ